MPRFCRRDGAAAFRRNGVLSPGSFSHFFLPPVKRRVLSDEIRYMEALRGGQLLFRWRQRLEPYRAHLLAFTCALMVDTISTIHFMCITGPEDEMHPIVRLAAMAWGPVTGPIAAAVYKLLVVMLIVFYFRPLVRPVLTVCTIFYLLAGIYNYFAVDMYTRGIVSWLPF